MPRLFIHATNVHQGGGKSLLTALFNSLPAELKVVGLLDSRMTLHGDIAKNLNIQFFSPSIWQRLKAEWWLAQNVQPQDTVLCFGNLPPLFKLQGRVAVFVQNRYLIEKVSLRNFPIKIRLRLGLERLWLLTRAANVDEFLVQTPSMKAVLLSSGCVFKQPVHIRPFASMLVGDEQDVTQNDTSREHKRYDFVYVASGEPHKNHKTLVQAWCLLASDGVFPSLCLTLDEKASRDLVQWIDQQRSKFNLQIENLGCLPHTEVRMLYRQAKALIYPSSFESFGLPLIEARQAGLPVLAPELDYVRDVIDPEQTFDSASPMSIARAVKRFMHIGEQMPPLQDVTEFIKQVLGKAE